MKTGLTMTNIAGNRSYKRVMLKMSLFFSVLTLWGCQSNAQESPATKVPSEIPPEVESYIANHPDNGLPSKSVGTAAKGSLVNGKLLPYTGPNYFYFDPTSYTEGRAFANEKLVKSVLQTYGELAASHPDRVWGMMETGYESGGPITFHNTHQNGLSMDFMTPLLKNGAIHTDLDAIGAVHYLLDFDPSGRLREDTTITIDFQAMASHLLALENQARKNGLKIQKVILKLNLKDEFFATAEGKKLKAKGVYFAQNLPKVVDDMHDDHYHVDFAPLSP